MKHFFSPSTTVFFRSDIHGEPGSEGNSLAADVVEVSSELYGQMLLVREQGGRVVPGEDGMPIEAPPLPPTIDEQEENARRWRDNQLTMNEWVATRHRDEVDMGRATTITVGMFADLMSYRQLLRDWPSAEGFPKDSHRPLQPEWLSAALGGASQ
jgi:hypothetical protein